MSLTVKETSSYTPPPAGTHFARCFAVIDLGTQPDDRYGPRAKVMLMFELPHERVKFDDNGQEKERPATISKEYTASLGKKADLRKHLDTWRGRPFTDDELKGFHLPSILNAPCCLTVIHKPKTTGGVSAGIAAISAPPKGTQVPPLWHPQSSFDIDDGNQSDTFKALPEWVQNKINKCIEWNGDTPPHESDAVDSAATEADDVPF